MQPLVFFGTPDFAVPTLAALAACELEPALVVTQPSRPAGRGQKTALPPVAERALELGLPLLQVERVRDSAFLARLDELRPEIAVVVAFGQIFPPALLALPRRGCVNLHASLLPRWRGAAPIQAAIAAGDRTTGVTTMVMEAGLDSGPILLQSETEVGDLESAGELSSRLAEIGATLVVETLRRLERGDVVARPQDVAGVTIAPKLTKEQGRLAWTMTAVELELRVRAFHPWPGVELPVRGEWVKVIAARRVQAREPLAQPAVVLAVERDALVVSTGGAEALALTCAQRPGRRSVSGGELASGLRLVAGDHLA